MLGSGVPAIGDEDKSKPAPPGQPSKPVVEARDAGAVRYTVGLSGEGETWSEREKLEAIKNLSKRIGDAERKRRKVEVESDGRDRLSVTIFGKPGEMTEENLRGWGRAVTRQGKLGFHMAHPDYLDGELDPGDLPEAAILLPVRTAEDEDPSAMLVQEVPEIEGATIRRAAAVNQLDRWQIMFSLGKVEAKLLFELSKKHSVPIDAGGTRLPLAIVIDGEVLCAPIFMEAIAGGAAMISGDFDEVEARAIASRMLHPLSDPMIILDRQFLLPQTK